MGCTLGRMTLPSPDSIRQQGDRLTVGHSGWAVSSAVEGQVLAAQITGYPNVDEPVVPFIYDATLAGGTLDGFYYVADTRVDWVKLAAGLFAFEVDLLAVPGKQAPLFEVLCSGALRSNTYSITTTEADPWVPISPYTGMWSCEGEDLSGLAGDLPKVDGPTYGVSRYEATVVPASLYDATVESITEPDQFYFGAARIERSEDGGTTWYTVVGRQPTQPPVAANGYGPEAGNYWRLSNGGIRLTVETGGSATMELEVRDPTTGAWESVITAAVEVALTAGMRVATVLQNSPMAAGLRLPLSVGGERFGTLDLTIRKGASWVEGLIRTTPSGTGRLIVKDADAAASTAITAGLHRTSDDANGNRWILASPVAQTNVTASGQLRTTSTTADEMPFMVGVEITGSSAASGSAAQEVVYTYMAAMRHRQRIVAR